MFLPTPPGRTSSPSSWVKGRRKAGLTWTAGFHSHPACFAQELCEEEAGSKALVGICVGQLPGSLPATSTSSRFAGPGLDHLLEKEFICCIFLISCTFLLLISTWPAFLHPHHCQLCRVKVQTCGIHLGCRRAADLSSLPLNDGGNLHTQ